MSSHCSTVDLVSDVDAKSSHRASSSGSSFSGRRLGLGLTVSCSAGSILAACQNDLMMHNHLMKTLGKCNYTHVRIVPRTMTVSRMHASGSPRRTHVEQGKALSHLTLRVEQGKQLFGALCVALMEPALLIFCLQGILTLMPAYRVSEEWAYLHYRYNIIDEVGMAACRTRYS
jgi:hypothetical protein